MITVDIRKANKINGQHSLFISFPYDNDVIEIMRKLPSRYWHKESKEWEVPFNKLSYIIENLQNKEFNICGEFINTDKPVIRIPKEFKFKTTPFKYQTEGFNYGLQNDRWLLGDEQGLGKTKQVIDIAVAKKLLKGYKHCLVICGVNGLKWNWVNEVKIHSDESAYILGQRYTNKGIKIGDTNDKIMDIDNLNNINDYFIITNVESLRNKDIITKLEKLCENGDIGIVAIDEIHKCKNPSSQQGKGILKLQSECRIAMTGTPLMNTPMDLYIILKWLGYEKNAFYSFKNHYCIMGGFGGYEIMGYKNLNELQERLNEIMLRRLKEDALDLPEKIFINEYVEMTAKQEIIYKEITNEIRANIDSIKMSNNPLAELIRMRQATGYTGILSSKIQESAKLDRMEELVEESVQNGRKVVIFSNWTQMTDVIFKRVEKFGAVFITGQLEDRHRQGAVNRFQNDPSCNVIVGTIGAMGTGLTLTAGTVEIFMDEPWNMALKEQAIDRCHRIGAKSNITVYTLMCKGTIDERINELVEQKGAMADALVDGKITVNKEELLEFLIN